MNLGFKQRILLVHAFILLLGVILSAVIYFNGKNVLDVTMTLIGQDQPTLQRISALKLEIAFQEPLLYEYYATVDRDAFLKKREASHRAIRQGLAQVRQAFPGRPELAEIERNHEFIRLMAEQLDETLGAEKIDWDKARLLLSIVRQQSAEINRHLESLVDTVERRVGEQGVRVQDRIAGIITLVVAFSAVVFLVAILVGYYVNAYLAEAAERRKLAMFPERNPNPVLSIDRGGAVTYSNPGAHQAMRQLGADAPAALLPPDYAARMAAAWAGGDEESDWEYQVDGRVYDARVHPLRDLDVAHVHLLDITERKRAEERLQYLAYHDALTGLPNRSCFERDLEQAIGAEGVSGLLLLHLDRFKPVIESYGHVMGDSVLKAAASRLGEVLAQCAERCGCAQAYRFEGMLFGVLLRGMRGGLGPESVAGHLARSMESPLHAERREFFLGFSMGSSRYPDDGADVTTLTRNAGTALHRARQQGDGSYQPYNTAMNARAREWLELENDLRRAVERDELVLFYQPQLDIGSGAVIGMEALLRWRHPARGMVSPGDFIPLAEETGLIVPIGAWVLREACRQSRAWRDAGLDPGIVAVNLSARQFASQDLPALVKSTLAEQSLQADWLELEVTESAAMQDVEAAIARLKALKQTGVYLSIDDFGTGYSSLSYLKRFPIDKLKVDQSFVRNLEQDSNDEAIVRAVVSLGHTLGLRVIAEGVETWEQLESLRHQGCEEMQGYLFSRPLPAPELENLLREGRALY